MHQDDFGIKDVEPHYDAIIVGSGAGGSTLAYQLSRFGRKVLVVERGTLLKSSRRHSSEPVGRYIHQVVGPNKLSVVGGDTKFYGSALYRMRESDFRAVKHETGVSPAWPIAYSDLEPYYEMAEYIYRVHGSPNGDPTEPPRSKPFPFPPIEHAPVVSKLVRRIESAGIHVSAIPRGIDYGVGGRCVLCSTCDGHYCQLDAKMDAEIAALRPAVKTGNCHLVTETECLQVLTSSDGARIIGALLRCRGRQQIVQSDLVAVCAGVPGSASLLRRSRSQRHPDGLGNTTGCLGRYLAGHSVGIIHPLMGWKKLPPAHTKTFAINTFYNGTTDWPHPMGVIQIAGQMPFWDDTSRFVRPFARLLGNRSLICFYMTEALPIYESQLIFDGPNVVGRVPPLENRRSFFKLRSLAIEIFHQAGHRVLARRRRPYLWHEVGTARFGTDPGNSVVDPNCQVHGINGLFVVDASILPSASAVNPALTICALALRAGDHILHGMN